MKQSVRLGRVAGIPIGAHWSVLIVAALLGSVLATTILPAGAPGQSMLAYVFGAAVVAVLFLACLLAHELAHALVARRQGIGVRGITLWLLGGVSELDGDPQTPRAEFLIAAVGPFVSLVLGGVAAAGAYLVDAGNPVVAVALVWLAGVNILLAIFNLLPGAPLDGGRIAHAVVWRISGDRDRAQTAASRAGVVLGAVLAALGVLQIFFRGYLGGLWLILLGWFLATAARAETVNVRLRRALEGRRVRDIMVAQPVWGHTDQSIDAFVTDTAARYPHTSYPVIDNDGRPIGLVHLADLARVPPAERTTVPLRAAVEPTATLAADEPATAAARTLTPATPLVPVIDQERLVGVVASNDLAHALELAELGRFGR